MISRLIDLVPELFAFPGTPSGGRTLIFSKQLPHSRGVSLRGPGTPSGGRTSYLPRFRSRKAPIPSLFPKTCYPKSGSENAYHDQWHRALVGLRKLKPPERACPKNRRLHTGKRKRSDNVTMQHRTRHPSSAVFSKSSFLSSFFRTPGGEMGSRGPLSPRAQE